MVKGKMFVSDSDTFEFEGEIIDKRKMNILVDTVEVLAIRILVDPTRMNLYKNVNLILESPPVRLEGDPNKYSFVYFMIEKNSNSLCIAIERDITEE